MEGVASGQGIGYDGHIGRSRDAYNRLDAPPVRAGLSEIVAATSDSVSTLHGVINELSAMLEPVLLQSSPSAESSGGNKPATAMLNDRATSNKAGVDLAAMRLRDIINRLTL